MQMPAVKAIRTTGDSSCGTIAAISMKASERFRNTTAVFFEAFLAPWKHAFQKRY